MNTAVAERTSGERDIDRFRGQFTVEFFAGQSFTSIIEQRFDFTFSFIDFGSASAFSSMDSFAIPFSNAVKEPFLPR